MEPEKRARPAFEDVYRRFAPVVHGIVLAHAGPRDAEDLVQDVFTLVHRKLHTLRDDAALPGWISAVARNVARDHLRLVRRRPSAAPLHDGLPGREEPARGKELRERALALLATVPEAQRETLVLRLVEGLTGPEIAARTGMTTGAVRVNLYRGMTLLRTLLRKEGWP